MLFLSLPFLLIFFPTVLILYIICKHSYYRNFILAAASLVFYAWGEPVFVFIFILQIFLNWFLARKIENNHENKKRKKTIFLFSILLNLLPFVLLKIFAGLPVKSLDVFGLVFSIPEINFPLGMSFFTFSVISYLVDVNRGDVAAEKNLLFFTNYMTFFPRLINGPITPYKDVAGSLKAPRTNVDEMANGLRRFLLGLSKKVLIADNLAMVTAGVFSQDTETLPAGIAWYGVLAFSLQIYFDFSGYSDMAIGSARMFGFRLPENFNFPYMSRSISDFWRRWHMTLMNFFRNYIFIPLEIARRKEKHFRLQSNILLIYLVTGLWHGISLNFILWGIYFGVVMVFEAMVLSKWLKKTPVFFQHLYTLLLIAIGWVFFKIENVGVWGPFFKALLGLNHASRNMNLRSENILLYFPLMVFAVVASTPLFANFYSKHIENRAAAILFDLLMFGLFVLSVSRIVAGNFHAYLYGAF